MSSGAHVEQVTVLLNCFCSANTLRARIDSLADLFKWTRRFHSESYGPGLLRVFYVLERNPQLCERFFSSLAPVLLETQAVHLFGEVGLPTDRGFFAELSDRLLRRVLPQPRDDQDLSNLLLKLVPTHRHRERWKRTETAIWTQWVQFLANAHAKPMWLPLKQSLEESLCLLAARIAALGLSEKLRARSSSMTVRQSPFFNLPRRSDALLLAIRSGLDLDQARAAWTIVVADCRKELIAITEHLERTGVSVDVVFSMDVIERGIARMESIVAVIVPTDGETFYKALRSFMDVLIQGKLEDTNLRDVAANNLQLLGRKIVERAGETGEHYITADRKEYRRMWLSAAGGGLLTVGTAAAKLHITTLHLPLFIEGLFASINYALSFILLQVLGLTLATKQPSMTAATLAGIVRESRGPTRHEELARYVARIVRSQLAAAMSNVLFVTAGSFLFGWAWLTLLHHTYLTNEKAHVVLKSLSPVTTGTFYYAALTGVILWLSSLAGGWLDNWIVYRRIPEALSEHRFSALIAKLSNSISSWGGSIALGFMLGMTPVIGTFFGLPLDVRHVTLSTGTLAFAVSTLGTDAFQSSWFILALAGIGVIFVLNLSVSFGLALGLALSARGVDSRERTLLRAAFFRHLRSRPSEFLFPPKKRVSLIPAAENCDT